MSSGKCPTIGWMVNASGMVIILGAMTAVSIIAVFLGSRLLFIHEGETAMPAVLADYYWVVVCMILVGLAVLLVSWCAFAVTSRCISRPIVRLAASVEKALVDSGKVELKANPQLNETHRLVVAFNSLLAERARQSEEIRNLSRNALHDIRSPLVQMCNEADQLAHGLIGAEEAALSIQKKGRALIRLVETSAEISRNYSGMDTSPASKLDLVELTRDVADVYSAGAEAKQIAFACTLPESPLFFLGHEFKFRRLVGNLLDNAIKFTSEGGRISVSLSSEGDGIELTVSDTGCGMSRSEQNVMYERFYRGSNAEGRPGTGLGLSMVHSIVMFYHGNIHCQSLRTGTTFRVRLPCDKNLLVDRVPTAERSETQIGAQQK